MGVSRLARGAALLLVAAVPVVLWVLGDRNAEPATPAAPTTDAPVDAPPELRSDILAVTAAGRRQVDKAGAVKADESLRFRVHLDRPAHVLIGRRDRLGGTHLVYPLGMAGRATAMPKGGPREVTQGRASVAGEETIVFYACARSFTWGDVKRLEERPGCARVARTVRAP